MIVLQILLWIHQSLLHSSIGVPVPTHVFLPAECDTRLVFLHSYSICSVPEVLFSDLRHPEPLPECTLGMT